MYIYGYRPGSRSARSLSEALQAPLIRHRGSRFVGSQNKTVLNWGASNLPDEVRRCRVLNKAEAVTIAGNKLLTLRALQNARVLTPLFTSDQGLAVNWVEEGHTVVARKVLTGHSGVGIEILQKGLDFVEAPLYTRYIPKNAEYRVHVMNGNVIDIQRKVKDPDRDVTDWKVRNHTNGFIFIRNSDDGRSYKDMASQDLKNLALKSVAVLGLEFGAVDVVYNLKRDQYYILEVNSAPGLEGSSVQIYADALRGVR